MSSFAGTSSLADKIVSHGIKEDSICLTAKKKQREDVSCPLLALRSEISKSKPVSTVFYL